MLARQDLADMGAGLDPGGLDMYLRLLDWTGCSLRFVSRLYSMASGVLVNMS
jgi:hypothetical protein